MGTGISYAIDFMEPVQPTDWPGYWSCLYLPATNKRDTSLHGGGVRGGGGGGWMHWEFANSFHLLTAPLYFLTISGTLFTARTEGCILVRVCIDLVFRTSAFSGKNMRLAMR